MSADNYYIVRRVAGGFTPVMGFASEEELPEPRQGARVYGTPEEALAAVAHEYAEYGARVHQECYEESLTLRARDLSGKHVGMLYQFEGTVYPLTRIIHTAQEVEVQAEQDWDICEAQELVELLWPES